MKDWNFKNTKSNYPYPKFMVKSVVIIIFHVIDVI